MMGSSRRPGGGKPKKTFKNSKDDKAPVPSIGGKAFKPSKLSNVISDDSDELSDVDDGIAKHPFPTARKGTRKSSISSSQTSRKSLPTTSSEASSATPLKKNRRALSPTNTRAARVPGDKNSGMEREPKRQLKRSRVTFEDQENRVEA